MAFYPSPTDLFTAFPKYIVHSHLLTLTHTVLPNHSVKLSSNHTSSITFSSYQLKALFSKKTIYLYSIPFIWQLNPLQLLSWTIMNTSYLTLCVYNLFHPINTFLQHKGYLYLSFNTCHNASPLVVTHENFVDWCGQNRGSTVPQRKQNTNSSQGHVFFYTFFIRNSHTETLKNNIVGRKGLLWPN